MLAIARLLADSSITKQDQGSTLNSCQPSARNRDKRIALLLRMVTVLRETIYLPREGQELETTGREVITKFRPTCISNRADMNPMHVMSLTHTHLALQQKTTQKSSNDFVILLKGFSYMGEWRLCWPWKRLVQPGSFAEKTVDQVWTWLRDNSSKKK